MRRLSTLTGMTLLLSPLGAVWAQQRDGFQLTSPLSVSAGYDNNFLAGSQSLSDTVVLLTAPTFSWTRVTHKTNFSVDYEPEFEIFSQYSNLNAWNHEATMHFSHRVNARLTIDAGDSFVSTMDPSRQMENSFLLLPRGLLRQNVSDAGVSYRLDGRTTVSFRADNAITSMALTGAQKGLLDQNSVAGTVSVDRTLNRHHSVSGSYSYLYILPLHPGSPLTTPANQALQNVDFGYVYTVNPGLIIRASAGMIRSYQFAYTAAGAVEKRVGDVWLTAGYQRYLAFFGPFTPIGAGPRIAVPFAQGVLPNSVYQVASFGIKGKLTRRLGVKASLLKARNEAGSQNGNIQSWVGRFRLDYKLRGPLVLFTQLDFYHQNLNEFSPLPLSRQRYFGGVEIVLSRPREAVDVPNQSINGLPDTDTDQTQIDGPPTGQRDN
jgi:hypothetical protein